MASLAILKTLKPGETKTFTFYLTWHYPNRFAWSKPMLEIIILPGILMHGM